MEQKTLFAEVVLPLALPRLFTYRVPMLLNQQIRELQRVVVPFGKQKRYTAIVWKLHQQPPKDYEARYIDQILDEDLSIGEIQQKFWEWIASYYLCSLGEVMQAALPAGLKLSSETKFKLFPGGLEQNPNELSDREYLILEALEKQGELKLTEVEKIAGISSVYPLLRKMLEKRLIVSVEEMQEKFKPRVEVWVRLADEFHSDKALNQLINGLKRANRQLELLLAYLSMPGHHDLSLMAAVKRTELIKKSGGGQAALVQAVKKGFFELEERIVSRLGGEDGPPQEIQLSQSQQTCLEQIRISHQKGKPVLLHGLTGSGKTEIYIRLIGEQLAQGKQVLYLLPEIALTAQIISRLRKFFGRKVQVYHSRFSENERVELWNAVSRDDRQEGSLILGARSSLFLPFKRLGLIIIDEEHEPSFKQAEPAPRYHARDAAIFLAGLSGSSILLGSATPSLESYYNALKGKYTLVKLNERYGGAVLPEISLVDIRKETIKRRMNGMFSFQMVKAMEQVIKEGGQIILFQNRRGFAPMLKCNQCQWIPVCVQCDISLTYHKSIHQLRCHYCGYSLNVPTNCIQCGSTDLKMLGFGTEKIEEELAAVLPGVQTQRMDLDTTRSKFAYHRIIEDFEQQRVQVLIGTQMVSKGLDFSNVRLVGVLNADSMLNYPDFRSFERSFQLLSQVAGRAGRNLASGKVLIQSWKPDHPILGFVQTHKYEAFYELEISERQRFLYPPFSRLIYITLKHEQVNILDEAAETMARILRNSFGSRILGPEYPSVARIRNFYQKRILLKIEPESSPVKIKTRLRENIAEFFSGYPLKSIRVVLDVDPGY
jgi:primosomal protein N' (replication factor Y) (superfamily II helicase)